MQKIVPCLWYDGDAEPAARHYAELIPGSQVRTVTHYPDGGQEVHGQKPRSVMTVEVRLGDTEVLMLNGGPQFKFTPAISLFVILEDRAAVDRLWEGLADGGKVMMPLDKYDWSERYGWVADRWGLNWQVALGRHADVGRTVTPSLLFAGEACGKAAGGDRALRLGLRRHASTGSTATTAAARTPPARSCTRSSASTGRRSWRWTAPRRRRASTRRCR